jgi:hypothetical protein
MVTDGFMKPRGGRRFGFLEAPERPAHSHVKNHNFGSGLATGALWLRGVARHCRPDISHDWAEESTIYDARAGHRSADPKARK